MSLLSLIALFLFTMVSCNTEPKQKEATMSEDDLIAAGEELDSLYLVAFNKGDVDALMKLHWNSPDLLAYPPGEQQLNGYDAIKTSYAKDFAANKGAKLEYLSVVNIPMGDGVVGHGKYRWTMPVEGGSPMVMEGRYSDIKEYKDGKMVIVFDHSSFPMPPPPPSNE